MFIINLLSALEIYVRVSEDVPAQFHRTVDRH